MTFPNPKAPPHGPLIHRIQIGNQDRELCRGGPACTVSRPDPWGKSIVNPVRKIFAFTPAFLAGALVLTLLTGLAPSAYATGKSNDKSKLKKDYALIVGTVWGPDDRPVYGVTVKIRRAQDKKPKWELMSDHHGEFAQRLPVGKTDYLVFPDLKDFKSNGGKQLHAGKEVPVHIENDERVDIGLHLSY